VTTPEGKIKKLVRVTLAHHRIWSFWPVPSGFQAATLDVLCVIRVRDVPIFFMIETKAPGKKLTARQKAHADDMCERLNVKVFEISTEADVAELKQWLSKLLAQSATAKPPTS
jgi:hypothetical protein